MSTLADTVTADKIVADGFTELKQTPLSGAILAFDTSSEVLSLGVARIREPSQEVDILEVKSMVAGRKHGEMLIPAIEELLKEAQIELSEIGLVVTTRGPGSFTGLRIGMATAKGLSMGAGIPMVSVPTLDYLAAGTRELYPTILSVLDGRKGRFYGTIYREGLPLEQHFDLAPEDIVPLLPEGEDVGVVGPDGELCTEALRECIARESKDYAIRLFPTATHPNPKYLITLGVDQYNRLGADPSSLGPLYIRKSQAEEAALEAKEK